VDLGNLTQKWIYDLGMNEEISTIDYMGDELISTIHFLGFLLLV
jgi:hypothetical protein